MKLNLPELRLHLTVDNAYSKTRQIHGTRDIQDLILPLTQATEEYLISIHLLAGNIVGYQIVAKGTVYGAPTTGREVYKAALLSNASEIILVHNHLTMDTPKPSDDDTKTTLKLMEAGELLGVDLLDHLIVNLTGEVFSFKATYPSIFQRSKELALKDIA